MTVNITEIGRQSCVQIEQLREPWKLIFELPSDFWNLSFHENALCAMSLVLLSCKLDAAILVSSLDFEFLAKWDFDMISMVR
jgi:hypothetical protein